jgi:hypothetical protein
MVVLGPGKYSPRAYIARRFQPILTAMVHVFRVRQRLDPEKGKVGLMKVDGNKPVDVSRTSGARGRAAGPSGFAPALPQEAKPLAQVASTASLAGVDALLALQGVASPAGERAKAVRRGRDMLDMLDDIRRGMLEGAVSDTTLRRLAGLVNVKREDFVDPGLSQVLDDIDLRARVELAKLEYAGVR